MPLTTDTYSRIVTKPLLLVPVLCLFAVVAGSFAHAQPDQADAADPAEQQQEEKRPARLLRLRLPITGNADSAFRSMLDRTRKQLLAEPGNGQRPVIVIEFVPLAGADGFGQGTDFSRAQSIARYLTSTNMTGIETCAFLPQSIKGHNVLVALACEKIAIASTAEFGEAGIDEDPTRPIDPAVIEGYRQIARDRRTAPEAIVVGLIDPSVEVLKVTTEARNEYIEADQLEALEQKETVIDSTTLIPAGSMGLLSASEARDSGTVRLKLDTLDELARDLGLKDGSLSEAASMVADWRPVMYTLEGPIDASSQRRAVRLIDNEILMNDSNWIGIRIHSFGGRPSAAMGLASYLAEIGADNRRVVAYVPEEAGGVAALVALSANQLVVHPGAKIGGENGMPLDESQIAALRDAIQATIPNTTRTWSLLLAMVDPDLEVFRYTNTQTGAERLFCEDEAKQQSDSKDWRRGDPITTPGEVLKLDSDQLVAFDIVSHVVRNAEELNQIYGFESSPPEVRVTWTQEIAEGLASPGVAVLLIVIAFCGIYFELHTPGMGIGGFIAALAILLFFWSKATDGSASWLEILLFVGGMLSIMLEVFVLPGLGIFGLGGALMVVASLVLAGQHHLIPRTAEDYQELQTSLAVVATSGILMVVMGLVLRRFLPSIPILNEIMLTGPAGEELQQLNYRESLAEFSHLMGHRGVTTTPLMPSGRAEFDGELVDVIAVGSAIDRGATVEVVSTRGSRVEVREVQ
ncbi:hypothetical protein Pan181_53380 [Aeoliella mucimassa]|uniref:Uncharacterized protein n=2 Tax=Aeoliella mucimassa TaxID=2527972 RepID=A0A518AWI7_9BACT|nr:hypothetical protein Pan181_53380 [Aeoliella mucimassa]